MKCADIVNLGKLIVLLMLVEREGWVNYLFLERKCYPVIYCVKLSRTCVNKG